MNPNDPLAALNPLREPIAIGAWPPAPGWWVLAGLVLAGLAALAWWSLQRWRRNRYRRQGLTALAAIEQTYQRDGDTLACASAVNRLLKAVALQAYPRDDVAALAGPAWLDFLNARSKASFDPLFAYLHYREASPDISAGNLLRNAGIWIRDHEVTA